ncbi:MAG TPA: cupin domain-containing protein [Phycisphaerales bacterium]|nr:cupin domain-containing protein [Phycisphaerales bacterium]HMP37287.1 cupin domain-containing protein [Phycisphaerales bacterium]
MSTRSLSAVNLAAKLATFSEPWQPRVVGEFNGHDILVAKFRGAFVWHSHEETDDLFLVLQGSVTIRLRDGEVVLGPGELFVVPRGIEHAPFAAQEAHVLLIERRGTPNTGSRESAAPRREI